MGNSSSTPGCIYKHGEGANVYMSPSRHANGRPHYPPVSQAKRRARVRAGLWGERDPRYPEYYDAMYGGRGAGQGPNSMHGGGSMHGDGVRGGPVVGGMQFFDPNLPDGGTFGQGVGGPGGLGDPGSMHAQAGSQQHPISSGGGMFHPDDGLPQGGMFGPGSYGSMQAQAGSQQNPMGRGSQFNPGMGGFAGIGFPPGGPQQCSGFVPGMGFSAFPSGGRGGGVMSSMGRSGMGSMGFPAGGSQQGGGFVPGMGFSAFPGGGRGEGMSRGGMGRGGMSRGGWQ